MVSSFMRSLDHTKWHTTVGRTSLHERSARRRDLYLTTHNTQHRHLCSRRDSNPHIWQACGRRPLGPAAKTHNQRTSTPTKNASDLCKQGTPVKIPAGTLISLPEILPKFPRSRSEKYRNIISRRTSRALPLISKSLRTTHACIRRCSVLFYTGSVVK